MTLRTRSFRVCLSSCVPVRSTLRCSPGGRAAIEAVIPGRALQTGIVSTLLCLARMEIELDGSSRPDGVRMIEEETHGAGA